MSRTISKSFTRTQSSNQKTIRKQLKNMRNPVQHNIKHTLKKPLRIKHTSTKTLINSGKPILELTNFRMADKQDLLEITSKHHIMKFIGLGKTWSSSDVDKYIKYTIQDSKIPAHKRQWFSYAVRYDGELAGVIEFKTMKISTYIPQNIREQFKNDVVMTIFINDKYQGKGLGKKIVELLKAQVRKYKPNAKKLIALVKDYNLVMQQIILKLGFTKLTNLKIIRKDGTESNPIIYTTEIWTNIIGHSAGDKR